METKENHCTRKNSKRPRHEPCTGKMQRDSCQICSKVVPEKEIVEASDVLSSAKPTMLDKILAGKTVLYIAPANKVVDLFTMPDDRMMCPHFERLKLASNGCFYQCDWCYLKLTYRAAFPFITIRAQYDKIKEQLTKRLTTEKSPVMFNSGELADSLAVRTPDRSRKRICSVVRKKPQNGYLFMLTKSDNVVDCHLVLAKIS